jgi:hypothetical protein
LCGPITFINLVDFRGLTRSDTNAISIDLRYNVKSGNKGTKIQEWSVPKIYSKSFKYNYNSKLFSIKQANVNYSK